MRLTRTIALAAATLALFAPAGCEDATQVRQSILELQAAYAQTDQLIDDLEAQVAAGTDAAVAEARRQRDDVERSLAAASNAAMELRRTREATERLLRELEAQANPDPSALADAQTTVARLKAQEAAANLVAANLIDRQRAASEALTAAENGATAVNAETKQRLDELRAWKAKADPAIAKLDGIIRADGTIDPAGLGAAVGATAPLAGPYAPWVALAGAVVGGIGTFLERQRKLSAAKEAVADALNSTDMLTQAAQLRARNTQELMDAIREAQDDEKDDTPATFMTTSLKPRLDRQTWSQLHQQAFPPPAGEAAALEQSARVALDNARAKARGLGIRF